MESQVFGPPVTPGETGEIHRAAGNHSSRVTYYPKYRRAPVESPVRLPCVILKLSREPPVSRRCSGGSRHECGTKNCIAGGE